MPEKISIIIGAQDKFSGAFDKLISRLPSLKTLAIGAAAAFAGTGAAIFAMAKSTATAYDSVQKLSDQLGISTEFISSYSFAADIAGIKQQTFTKSIQMLQVRIGEASRGIGEGKDAFEALGVELVKTNGELKTSEDLLPDLAEAFHNMSNATERAEAASKIFGQRGISMLQMFKDGKEGLAEMTEEAEKFGLVVSAQAGANAAEFNDSLTRLTGSLTGLKNKMAEEVMPTITGLANRFADFVANNRDQIIEYGVKFLEVMGNITEKGAFGVAILIDSWRGLQMTWEVLKIGFAEFSVGLWEGIQFLQEKLLVFMEVMNFGGVFDGAIESAQSFTESIGENIAVMTEMSEAAQARLNELAGDETAISKVGEIKNAIKTAIAEIQAAGTAEVPTGIHPFDDANVEKTAENLEALRALRDEHLLTETEKLEEWRIEELAKYQGNAEAKALIDEIYGKKRADLQGKLNKESIKSEKINQDGLNAIAQAGSIKGFGILKAAALPEIAASTETGAIAAYKALAGIPIIGPALGAAAAAAVIAYGAIRGAKVTGLTVAHGGLDFVPREQPMFVDKGERILSSQQNIDLVEFMKGGGETIAVENFNFIVPVTLDEIKRMDREDWRELTEDQIIPALRDLSTAGIKV